MCGYDRIALVRWICSYEASHLQGTPLGILPNVGLHIGCTNDSLAGSAIQGGIAMALSAAFLLQELFQQASADQEQDVAFEVMMQLLSDDEMVI